MPTVTLSALRTMVLDVTDYTDSEHVGTAFLNYCINTEGTKLHDLLVGLWEDYFIKTAAYPTTRGRSPLPVDFLKLSKIYHINSGGTYTAFERVQPAEIPAWLNQTGGQTLPYSRPGYALAGNELWVLACPSEGSIEMWYVPGFKELVADTDRIEINIPVGWVDYIVQGVAARIALKDELDPSAYKAMQSEIEGKIRSAATNRDQAPGRVVDVRGRFYSRTR